MNILLDELVKTLIENKMVLVMFLQFVAHKSLSYYVLPGRKRFKGYVKFLIGQDDKPKVTVMNESQG